MPSTWHIDVLGVDPRYVRASGIHAFLSSWFGEGDREHNDLKGYSLGRPVPFSNGIRLVVSCTDDALAQLLADLPAGQPVRFGTTHPRVGRVASPPRCQAKEPWAELLAPRPATAWRLEFLTPVTLRRTVGGPGRAARRERINQPWPAPDAILSGLRNRWHSSGGPALPGEITEHSSRLVAVTGVELRTARADQAPEPTIGALGMVEWTWCGRGAADEPARATVDSLVRFSAFSGCGAYPQFGLGCTAPSDVVAQGRPGRPG